MALDFLTNLALSALAHDALVAIGIAAAGLAGLAFARLGGFQPERCAWLNWSHASASGGYVEFGPAERPKISAPAPRRVDSPRVALGQKWVAGSYTWR